MALDSRFVLATPLQLYFVDKDTGLPLTNGKVYFWEDEARTTPKPVYQITGTPPNYVYSALPNPIELSGVGTVQYNNNDILYYYFPYDGTPDDSDGTIERYYIEVFSEQGVQQFTREGMPNISAGDIVEGNISNYVPNGQFLLHNDIAADDTHVVGEIRQPVTILGQGGWTFERPPMSSAKDIVTFIRFGSNVTDPTTSPRYAVQVVCQDFNSGDGYKDLRLEFTDVNKFASDTDQYTFAFTAESTSGSSLPVTIWLIKNYGTGGDANTEVQIGSATLTASYEIYNQSFIFGLNTGESIGILNDDYLQIAIRFPTSSIFSARFTDFVLTDDAVVISTFPVTPDNEFKYQSIAGWADTPAYNGADLYLPLILTPYGVTYDRSTIGNVIATAGAASTPPISWLFCDGTQYEYVNSSSDGIPYARLGDFLWDSTLNVPVYGGGPTYLTAVQGYSTSELLIINNSGGAVTSTGDGAIPTGFTFSDVTTGNTTSLVTSYLVSSATFYIQSKLIGSSTGGTIGNSGFTYAAIQLSHNIVDVSTLPQIISFTAIAAASITAGHYFTTSIYNGTTAQGFYVWYIIDTVGTDPAISGSTGIPVNILSTDTAASVALKTSSVLNGFQTSSIIVTSGSTVPASSNFIAYTPSIGYNIWYKVDNVGTQPTVAGTLPIEIDISSSDTAAQVMQKTLFAINRKYYCVPDYRGWSLRGFDPSGLKDAGPRYSNVPGRFGNLIGTQEDSSNLNHDHHALPDGAHTGIVVVGGGAQSVPAGSDITSTDGLWTTYTGKTESRPINKTVQYIIKY